MGLLLCIILGMNDMRNSTDKKKTECHVISSGSEFWSLVVTGNTDNMVRPVIKHADGHECYNQMHEIMALSRTYGPSVLHSHGLEDYGFFKRIKQ